MIFDTNYYSISEVIEYEMVRAPNDVWYAKAYSVVGVSRRINGQEVNEDGTPAKKPSDPGLARS